MAGGAIEWRQTFWFWISEFWDIFSSMAGDFFSQQQNLHTQMIDGRRSTKVV